MKTDRANFFWTILLLASFFATGCMRIPADNASADDANSGTADSTTAAAGEGQNDGWLELEEPLGDESFVEIRFTPQQPAVGEEVKVEVKAGSAYGRFHGKVWAHAGASNGMGSDAVPVDDPGWQELKEVAAMIEDADTGKMVPLGDQKEDPLSGLSGETHYAGTVTFTNAGKGAVSLKFVDDHAKDKPMHFEIWQTDVKPAAE